MLPALGRLGFLLVGWVHSHNPPWLLLRALRHLPSSLTSFTTPPPPPLPISTLALPNPPHSHSLPHPQSTLQPPPVYGHNHQHVNRQRGFFSSPFTQLDFDKNPRKNPLSLYPPPPPNAICPLPLPLAGPAEKGPCYECRGIITASPYSTRAPSTALNPAQSTVSALMYALLDYPR